MMKLIDSHSHLEEIENINSAIERARNVGVIAIVGVGSDEESNRKILGIAERHKGFIFPALGMHPQRLKNINIDGNFRLIEENIDKAAAIGEIGLDYKKRKKADKDFQKAVLKDLLLIAKKHQKPVILHGRYAWEEVFNLVKESEIEEAIFHWYNGFQSLTEEIIKADYFVSATPALEYSLVHREAIKSVPLENLLLETDSPVVYSKERKYTSQPADVLKTLKLVAGLKNIEEEKVAEWTTGNAIKVFSLPY